MSRLLFISLEFSAGTFSGNGVYARSQVRSLCNQGCRVLVFSGKPTGYTAPDQAEGAQQLIQVEVPVWDRLDKASGWSELAVQAASDNTVQHVAAFQAEAVLGVDWSSLPAYKALAAALQAKGLPVPPYVYMNYRVYLRTCAPADQEFMQGMESEAAATAALIVALSRNDADFIKAHLLPGHRPAPVLVLLPALRSDMASIPLPVDQPQPDRLPPSATNSEQQQQKVNNRVMDPSGVQTSMEIDNESGQSTAAVAAQLQQSSGSSTASDIAAKAADESPIRPVVKQTSSGSCVSPIIGRRTTAFSSSSASGLASEDAALTTDQTETLQAAREAHEPQLRPYLTCCVRLSPEKEPHRFVELVQELARQGSLRQLGIKPLMCASSTTPYAMELVSKLQVDAPNSIIETRFLGPKQLAEIYSKTRLNIHPCLYDAYGMTVVEAASQGAPSVVNGMGAVGATDLLRAPSEVFELDLSMPTAQLAKQVAALWTDAAKLAAVSKAAAHKARSWTEAANAEMLLSLVKRCLHGRA